MFSWASKTKLIHRSAEFGDIVVISVSYNKGGMNYATYKTEPRGIYVSIQPMKREKGEHFISESFAGFSGCKMLAKPVDRISAKQLEIVADAVTPALDEICTAWMAGKQDAAKYMLFEWVKQKFPQGE